MFNPKLILLKTPNPPGLVNRKMEADEENQMVPISQKQGFGTLTFFFVKLLKCTNVIDGSDITLCYADKETQPP